jgi:Mn2+/Fe2+ NRAMP family transporter
VAAGALPTLPRHDAAHYWFIAVSILGASISPYLFFFYSSGAIEDKWDASYLATNRAVAGLGMSFGTLISIAVLVLAAVVLLPRGIKVDHYNQLPQLLVPLFGSWGFYLFAASLGIACFGAAQEISLEMAYFIAQTFGWNWGKDERPRDTPRFSLVYMATIFVAAVPVLVGLDPLQMTVFSMALTAATLPLTTLPFIVLMNDEHYVGEHRNGWFSNIVVVLIIALAFVLAVVSIPLEIFGA